MNMFLHLALTKDPLWLTQADVDNSGTIDYGEFVAAMLHLNKVQREDHMFAAFSFFDKDGSGYITKDELQQACEQFGFQESQIEEIIREVDQDKVYIVLSIHFWFFRQLHLVWRSYRSFFALIQDGLIDYSEFVAMMEDTGLGIRKCLRTV